MKRINLAGKKYNIVKSRIREQQDVYVVNVSSTHSQLPLDSIICGDALQVLRTFPGGIVDLIVTSPHTPTRGEIPMAAFIPTTTYNGSRRSL